MHNYKKTFKFYLYRFIYFSILVIVYNIYSIYTDSVSVSDLAVTWVLPFIFIGVYYLGNNILDKFKKKKHVINYEVNFLETISSNMRKSGEFILEDFRKLKSNDKFQKAVKDAYNIYENGETELYNFQRLEKKFRKDSIEHNAILFVISYIKENRKNNQSE